MARHSRPFPWFNEEEEQHGRKRDNERRANHRRVSCAERVREDVLEGVDPPTKKGHDEEAGQAPEGAHEPAAHDQGLGRTQARSLMDDSAAHGSILRRVPVNGRRLRVS